LGQGRLFGAARTGARRSWFGPAQSNPGPARSVKSGNAEDQRARIASALDRRAELAGLAWRWGRWFRWCIPRCREAGHQWRDLCLPCDNDPALGRGAFAVSIESPRCLFGAAGTGRGRCGAIRFRSVPSCPSSPPGRWRLVMLRGSGAGWLDWRVDGSKSSFRAKQSADPESMPH